MENFNPSSRFNPAGLEDGYPARRVDPESKRFSCKRLQKIELRRVTRCGDSTRLETNPGSCKEAPIQPVVMLVFKLNRTPALRSSDFVNHLHDYR